MPEIALTDKYLMQKYRRTCLTLLFFCVVFFSLHSQELQPQSEPEPQPRDTTTYDESYKLDSSYHNPQKAALMSALLPGLGQIYNKRVWKVPIVYAGFGTLAFFIHYNQKGYLLWKQAYIDFPNYDLEYDFPLTIDQIDRTKNSYKRYRDLSIIGTAGFYLLQIIDATVDAYLFNWDISEDLSLRIEPSIIQSPSFLIAPSPNTFALRASVSF